MVFDLRDYDSRSRQPGMSIKRCSVFIGLVLSGLMAGCDRPAADSASDVAVTFGQRQLDQMLDDRPEMRSALPSSHPAFVWVLQGFNGERAGSRIYWNANSPLSGRPAEHGPAYESYPAYISISGGTETTAIDKWASLVYEFCNLENTEQFEDLSKQAIDGLIDADGFAEKCLKLEFEALIKTREFFQKHPLPVSKHGRDKWYNWVTSDFGTFEDFKASFNIPGENPFNSNYSYFKNYYESTLMPYADVLRREKP